MFFDERIQFLAKSQNLLIQFFTGPFSAFKLLLTGCNTLYNTLYNMLYNMYFNGFQTLVGVWPNYLNIIPIHFNHETHTNKVHS